MTNIHSTAVVDSSAVLGDDVEVGPFCVIGPNATVGSGTKLKSHVVLDGHIKIGSECEIFPFASLGTQTQDLKYAGGDTYVEIGDKTTIREYVTVNSGTVDGEVTKLGSNCHIMAYAHIAHGCVVGDGVIMANCATLAGHIVVQDKAIIGGLCAVHQFCRIGSMSMIGGCSKITQDVPPFMLVDGNPASVHGLNRVGLKRRGVSLESQKNLKEAFRILYREDLSTRKAIEKINAQLKPDNELNILMDFVKGSERGIIK